MAPVVELERWRRERAAGAHAATAAQGERLERAVERLDRLLAELGWHRRAPSWVVTELLAIQGAVSMGLTEEAAIRAETLAARSARRRARR
ncbi:MAG: hypothetical protein ACRDI0_08830 [Actinomycetota bacterium]